MPRTSLVDLVANVIDQRLRAERFERHRRTWYLTNDLGDYALVELQSSPRLPGMERFHVNTGVVPAPLFDWMATVFPGGRGRNRIPTTADGLLVNRVDAPDGGPHGLGWTVSDSQMAVGIGAVVADLLTAGPTVRLRGLLDRSALWAELVARNALTPDVEAAFAAEGGPSADFERLLGRVVEWKADSDDFVAWATSYAKQARRTSAG